MAERTISSKELGLGLLEVPKDSTSAEQQSNWHSQNPYATLKTNKIKGYTIDEIQRVLWDKIGYRNISGMGGMHMFQDDNNWFFVPYPTKPENKYDLEEWNYRKDLIFSGKMKSWNPNKSTLELINEYDPPDLKNVKSKDVPAGFNDYTKPTNEYPEKK